MADMDTSGDNPGYSLWPEDMPPRRVTGCHACALGGRGVRLLWGEGNPNAPVMVLVDNPGAREDSEGNPFICSSRLSLLDALAASGLRQKEVYLTYLLKCRPIRGYDREESMEACLPYLERQIAARQPQMLVCMGSVVAKTLFGQHLDVRGQWVEYKGTPPSFSSSKKA